MNHEAPAHVGTITSIRGEKNIDSIMTDLNRTFYRLRQSSIDEERFDVIAEFNALSSKASTL